MGMFHCDGCWENPCVCGKNYEDLTKEDRIKLANTLIKSDKDKFINYLTSSKINFSLEDNETESIVSITASGYTQQHLFDKNGQFKEIEILR